MKIQCLSYYLRWLANLQKIRKFNWDGVLETQSGRRWQVQDACLFEVPDARLSENQLMLRKSFMIMTIFGKNIQVVYSKLHKRNSKNMPKAIKVW